MPTRAVLIERILRHVYGELPTDDANITNNLVNTYIQDGIGLAAKQNYKESIQIDGVEYVNNSFYTTYRSLPVVKDPEQFVYVITFPQIPFGIGSNIGISALRFVDVDGKISDPAIPLSENQWGYYRNMRPIPNKILFKPEGIFAYAISTLQLNSYTANVTMISGGDSTNLNSILNVPDDYIPIIFEYCSKILMQERMIPKDIQNDGQPG